jgi:hypothetical protein
MELRKIGILDGFRARSYWLMDFVKGPRINGKYC